VAGEQVRLFYQALFFRVRVHGEPIELRCRCDGPRELRVQRLRIERIDGRILGLHVHTLEQSVIPYNALLDPVAERSGREIQMCSLCKRVRAAHGSWIELDRAAGRLGLLAEDRPPALVWDICPACRELPRARS
jgi:hypothetical protein